MISLKRWPIKLSTLSFHCCLVYVSLFNKEAMPWKSDSVFSQIKAFPWIYNCIIFRLFEQIPNNSAAIILRSVKVPLAFLYTSLSSVVETNGPCCKICSPTAVVPKSEGRIFGLAMVTFFFNKLIFSSSVPGNSLLLNSRRCFLVWTYAFAVRAAFFK